jgi:putative transposase
MRSWPHAPQHAFYDKGVYMITGATRDRILYFKTDEELELLHDTLLELAEQYQWILEAWAVFPNHYHFIARSPEDPISLGKFISHLHSLSARKLNSRHQMPGRKIWYQYWDTKITFQSSYLARLNYVIQNPVKHGVVEQANKYRWCSASWFELNTSKAYFDTVTSVKIDQVNVADDF